MLFCSKLEFAFAIIILYFKYVNPVSVPLNNCRTRNYHVFMIHNNAFSYTYEWILCIITTFYQRSTIIYRHVFVCLTSNFFLNFIHHIPLRQFEILRWNDLYQWYLRHAEIRLFQYLESCFDENRISELGISALSFSFIWLQNVGTWPEISSPILIYIVSRTHAQGLGTNNVEWNSIEGSWLLNVSRRRAVRGQSANRRTWSTDVKCAQRRFHTRR